MTWRRLRTPATLALVAATVLGSAACERKPPMIDAGDLLGRVRVYQPKSAPTGFAFLLSGSRGWTHRFDRAAKRLRDHGFIVAGVDSADVLARLRNPAAECIDLAGDFENTSQTIQKEAGVGVYMLPILAGAGEGGTLALAGLWQAGPQTFAGAATVNFRPLLRTATALCAEPPGKPAPQGVGWLYPPQSNLFGWWRSASTEPASAEARAFANAAGAEVTAAPADTSPSRLVTKLVDSAEAAGEGQPLMLGELPVVDLPGRPGSDTAVMILSGDGGWRDLDRTLGHIIADAGVPVIGIDCLRYFWSARTPEEVAKDLARLIADVVARTGASRIALVGFSFGADVLPAVYNRLDDQARKHVALLSLLAPGQDAHFEIHLQGWLGGDSAEDASPVAPELARIDPHLVQCVYGEEEAGDSGCLGGAQQAGEVVRMPGGHHFDEDYPALARRILDRLKA